MMYIQYDEIPLLFNLSRMPFHGTELMAFSTFTVARIQSYELYGPRLAFSASTLTQTSLPTATLPLASLSSTASKQLL